MEILFENDDVVVRLSPIHGMGVFAKRNFKKGEIVLVWNPARRSFIESNLHISEAEKHYTNHLDTGEYIVMGIPERYVNHSCEPNTKINRLKDVAIRDIEQGEEITGDYQEEGWLDFKCACGKKNCKK